MCLFHNCLHHVRQIVFHEQKLHFFFWITECAPGMIVGSKCPIFNIHTASEPQTQVYACSKGKSASSVNEMLNECVNELITLCIHYTLFTFGWLMLFQSTKLHHVQDRPKYIIQFIDLLFIVFIIMIIIMLFFFPSFSSFFYIMVPLFQFRSLHNCE